jgi:phosphoserine phosphatase
MKLAVYDFDGTYMKTQVLPHVFRFWKEKELNMKQFRRIWRKIMWRYFLHKFNLCGWNKRTFRANAMALTADLFRTVDRNALDKFLEELYIHLKTYINQDLKKQLEQDKADGFYTILLSGNFDIILNPFLIEGFDEVIGSSVLENGEVIPSNKVKIIIHDIKAKTIKDKFPEADYENSKAYADSYYDLPILEIVGNPIVVNPDEKLLVLAKERQYKVFK